MPHTAPDIVHHAQLDERMVHAAAGIRLLALASWPASILDGFLADHARGVTRLPGVEYPRHDFSEERAELEAVAAAADPDHPLGAYLVESARDWDAAARFCECLGTDEACDLSMRLYGHPESPLPGHGPGVRWAARRFIAVADELHRDLVSPAEQWPISATSLALQLQSDLDDYFNERVIQVVLDPDLVAKAAAGATRIRLRTGAAFTEYDRHQLREHEAFVHSLTALNGEAQPVLRSLGLSSPRVTATQEGLATFAEQATGNLDIERIKRLSLRVEAVAMALEGADFIEVFRYFLQAGQSPEESAASAQRVFRGMPVTGGAAFTKDTVYLRGLIGVHTFYRWALRTRQLQLGRWLFAGKMTLGDVQRFAPLFEAGVLLPPRWIPRWLARANGLAGMLAFSLFANRIQLQAIDDAGFLDI